MVERFRSWACSAEIIPAQPDHPIGPTEAHIDISTDGIMDLEEAKSLFNWLQRAIKEIEDEQKV